MTDTRKTDLEEMERGHMQRTLAAVVGQIRRVADQIEAEARRGILEAAAGSYEWSTYGRVASQAVHTMTWGVANAPFQRLIETAADADRAKLEKTQLSGLVSAQSALAGMAQVAQGWAAGAIENGANAEGPDEVTFTLADVLRMVDDAARGAGITPFAEKD